MEQLVARWKQTTSSTNASRYSDRKKLSGHKSQNQSASPSSSSDDSIEKQIASSKKSTPSKSRLLGLSGLNNSQGKAVEHDSKRSLKTSDLATNSKISSNDNYIGTNTKPVIDTIIEQIFRLFKAQYNGQINQELRSLLLEYGHSYSQTNTRELQQKLHLQDKQLQILKQSQSSSKDDISRKMIIELENKLAESEHSRVMVTEQKDQLGKKLNDLLHDIQRLSQKQDNNERMQKEFDVLSRNNAALLQQIKMLQEKDENQQIIWNQQVEDLLRMMDILKTQLQKQ